MHVKIYSDCFDIYQQLGQEVWLNTGCSKLGKEKKKEEKPQTHFFSCDLEWNQLLWHVSQILNS